MTIDPLGSSKSTANFFATQCVTHPPSQYLTFGYRTHIVGCFRVSTLKTRIILGCCSPLLNVPMTHCAIIVTLRHKLLFGVIVPTDNVTFSWELVTELSPQLSRNSLEAVNRHLPTNATNQRYTTERRTFFIPHKPRVEMIAFRQKSAPSLVKHTLPPRRQTTRSALVVNVTNTTNELKSSFA